MAFETVAEAAAALPCFIEEVYNMRWLHSALSYLSPITFEEHHARQAVKATA